MCVQTCGYDNFGAKGQELENGLAAQLRDVLGQGGQQGAEQPHHVQHTIVPRTCSMIDNG